MPACGVCRKQPGTTSRLQQPHFHNRLNPVRHRNTSCRVVGLTPKNMYNVCPHVLRSETVAFLRAQRTVNQDRGYVVQKVRVLMVLHGLRTRSSEVQSLFIGREYALSSTFA